MENTLSPTKLLKRTYINNVTISRHPQDRGEYHVVTSSVTAPLAPVSPINSPSPHKVPRVELASVESMSSSAPVKPSTSKAKTTSSPIIRDSKTDHVRFTARKQKKPGRTSARSLKFEKTPTLNVSRQSSSSEPFDDKSGEESEVEVSAVESDDDSVRQRARASDNEAERDKDNSSENDDDDRRSGSGLRNNAFDDDGSLGNANLNFSRDNAISEGRSDIANVDVFPDIPCQQSSSTAEEAIASEKRYRPPYSAIVPSRTFRTMEKEIKAAEKKLDEVEKRSLKVSSKRRRGRN